MSVLSRASRTRLKSSGSSTDTLPLENQSFPQSFSQTESADEVDKFAPTSLNAKELDSLNTTSPQTLQIDDSNVTGTRSMSNLEKPTNNEILIDQPVTGIDGDDRSSSLSDIEGRPGHESPDDNHNPSGQEVEGDDTDAETERLEESPHKLRKHQNVVLSFSKKDSLRASEPLYTRNEGKTLPQPKVSNGTNAGTTKFNEIQFDQTSDTSSLGESITENSRPVSPAIKAGKKRKRSIQDESGSEQGGKTVSLIEAATNLASHVHRDAEQKKTPKLAPTDTDSRANGGHDTQTLGNHDGGGSIRGTRDTFVNDEDAVDTVLSNGEDIELEGDAMEADLAARNEEELVKKKTALDALGAIEKCFATLRDKLFDDRLAQYNEELTQLAQPNPVHSEYLVMMECIDQRRDEKIEHEQTLLRYKLQALERKSVAERAQLHGQYMQTARDTRDRVLEQISKEWYQIQRERRSWDGDLPCYMYKFPTKRSQQITQQTAYNTEVSVLSGIAKYVGFPSAPEITGARSNEIDDDLKSMGIALFPGPVQQFQPPPIRVNSSMSNVSRPRPDAEVDFLQQTPWANPQHPVHHQSLNIAHRQIAHHSRPQSPFVTPKVHRRTIDNSQPIVSPVTVADLTSVHDPAIVPTPSGMDPSQSIHLSNGLTPHTPSKPPGIAQQEASAQTSPKSGTAEKGFIHASVTATSPIVLDAISPTRAAQEFSNLPHKFHRASPSNHSPRAVPSSPFKNPSPQLREEADQVHRQNMLIHTHSPHPIGVGARGAGE